MKLILYFLTILTLSSCLSPTVSITNSGINVADFDTIIERKDVRLLRIVNDNKMEVCLTNYGARIVSIMVPDKNDNFSDVVCGFKRGIEYYLFDQNFGSVVGRYIGRIDNAQFSLDGVTYQLKASGKDSFHGGNPGFADRIWKIGKMKKNSIQLTYISSDGENGFPGELTLHVTYTLNEQNELIIDYKAKTTKPTVLNPSNHSFFNISGDFSQTVLNQKLRINGDSIAEYNRHKCMTGRFISVEGTPFDFKESNLIGERINDKHHEQIVIGNGYDHTWKINGYDGSLKFAASISDPGSGRIMEIYTTEPGLHVYSVNGLDLKKPGKHGFIYKNRTSICFETMHFANSPNIPNFPSTVLRPNETFKSQTIFKFKTN